MSQPDSPPAFAFRGAVVHSRALDRLEVLPDALIVVEGGRVAQLTDLLAPGVNAHATLEAAAACCGGAERIERLGPRQLLVPGFVDGHAHAPQYVFAGTGMDLPLLEWLEKCVARALAESRAHSHWSFASSARPLPLGCARSALAR